MEANRLIGPDVLLKTGRAERGGYVDARIVVFSLTAILHATFAVAGDLRDPTHDRWLVAKSVGHAHILTYGFARPGDAARSLSARPG